MPLDVSQVVDGVSPIPAASVTQFYELLTGLMTDQPVTLRNRVAVGGSQSIGETTLTLAGVTGQTAYQLRLLKLLGDAFPSFAVTPAGTIAMGPGGASSVDTTIGRFAAGLISLSSGIVVTQSATPAAPGFAGLSNLYVKSDGLWYSRAGVAGAETPIGGTNVTDPLVAQVFG